MADRIDSIDDPRVAAYRNLRDRTLRGEEIFLAEGRLVAERLLASPYQVESVLAAEEHAAPMESVVGRRAPLYVAPAGLVRQIVGFPFHRGVLALGRRGPLPGLDAVLAHADPAGRAGVLVLPDVHQPENLGLILRTAAGFGVDAALLGPKCCDPLSRRSLRLSMGEALRVPLVRSADVAADLHTLRDRHGIVSVAAVLDPAAQPAAEFRWPRRAALVLGNEYAGLDPALAALCGHRVTIPMRSGTDSLNVGVAAGILLYEMMKATAGPR